MTLLAFIELFRRISKRMKVKRKMIEIKNVRFEMNPRNLKWGFRPKSYIDKIIVHQELGWGSAEQVHEYHISEKSHLKPGVGAPAIAYHFVVEADGQILQVNDDTAITWHCKGENMHSLGIMVVGDFAGIDHSGDEPWPIQIESIEKLLDHLIANYNLTKNDVYGHEAFGKPACPGFTISNLIRKYNKEGNIRI